MHTKNSFTQSSRSALLYHDRKVKQGVAECLYAGNMLKEAERLTLQEMEFFLQRVLSLNERVAKPVWQIFLSLQQDERIDNDKMRKIAQEYLKEMGWDRQPYLIYRHSDTPNSHLHILISKIRSDGTRINLTPTARRQSWELTRRLERKYGLYEAGRRVPDKEWAQKYPVQKVEYGVTPLKPAMNAVLEYVLPHYRFASLEELNAVLRPYNILASRGREDSLVYKKKGLMYVALKDSGQPERAYVKASLLRCKPTLPKLEQQMMKNRGLREQYRQRFTTAIDWSLAGKTPDRQAFEASMAKEGIGVVWQQAKGAEPGIWYVHHPSGTIFDGVALGAAYTAQAVLARCLPETVQQQEQQQKIQPILNLSL